MKKQKTIFVALATMGLHYFIRNVKKLKEIVGKYANNTTDSDVRKRITLFDMAIDQKNFVICFGIFI